MNPSIGRATRYAGRYAGKIPNGSMSSLGATNTSNNIVEQTPVSHAVLVNQGSDCAICP